VVGFAPVFLLRAKYGADAGVSWQGRLSPTPPTGFAGMRENVASLFLFSLSSQAPLVHGPFSFFGPSFRGPVAASGSRLEDTQFLVTIFSTRASTVPVHWPPL